jgi:pimeloyl-ACP methyl ester carboxylesterase
MRFDKRGCGASQGEFRSAGFEDLVSDADAALDYLEGLSKIDGNRIGILGKSEGAVVALSVASSRRSVSFYVWESGFVQSIRELAEFQLQDLRSAPPEDLDQMKSTAPYLYWETLQGPSLLDSALKGDATFVIGDDAWSLEESLDYYRQVSALNLAQRLGELSIPTLIAHGANDSVVPAVNAQMAAEILRNSGRAEFTLYIFPGIEHCLFAADATPQIVAAQKVILPDQGAVDAVVSWIANHVGEGSRSVA